MFVSLQINKFGADWITNVTTIGIFLVHLSKRFAPETHNQTSTLEVFILSDHFYKTELLQPTHIFQIHINTNKIIYRN